MKNNKYKVIILSKDFAFVDKTALRKIIGCWLAILVIAGFTLTVWV